VTESHDENKQPKRVIDFDMLRAELSGEMIEGLDERYHLNWPGKRAALLAMRAPVAKTLRPKRDDSEGFDKTQNLFIEGDNLDALRLLQKSYLSKVKMIYIDPPYNTGNDFIYKDDFKEKTGEYLLESEQTDEDGNRLETNTESNGRFHSDWLSMMYPRLKLARNLLRDDGVIFISIDDNEQANLKKLCDEIFGAENFVACVANISNPKGRSDDKYVATAHEYILIYKKNDLSFGGWKPDEKIIKRFNKIDDRGEIYREIDLRKTGDNDRREDRPNMYYALFYDKNSGSLEVGEHDDNNPEKIKILPKKEDGLDGCWRWGKETTQQNLDNLVARYMPVRKRWSVFLKS
ncbi:MAG: site-specific DNA-methyltransferase, partial [Proteobacteria bacterium]|nr:site-specific DNA-methyltransferase [Pseudomonadota bacterium]